MCQRNRHGHQLGGFIACIAEHHPLVPCTGRVLLAGIGVAVLERIVHAHCNIPRLLVNAGQHRTGLAVKPVFRAVIADLFDRLARDRRNIHITFGRNFTHNHHHAGGHCGFAGDTRPGIICNDRIEHRVRNLVADFVRMSLGDRLGCKQILRHKKSNSFLLNREWFSI